MSTKKHPGTIHRTVALLEKALGRLQADLPEAEIERIAVMVHRGMSRQQRSFHTPEHIFALADPEDPHGTLAALFHDLVYYQVDDGFEAEVGEMLQPYIEIDPDGSVALARNVAPDARAFHGCTLVFGFSPGAKLSPFAGLNEFLSALVMGLLFEGTITDMDLLIATACIEATIPFRGADSNGRRPPARLRERLETTVADMDLSLDEDDVDWVVVQAVTFANRDVRNFAEEDVARFLDNTWKLLPETNPELRFVGVYTINSYRVAVQKMRGFLTSLNPDNVFQRFKTEPPEEEYTRLLERTRRNLAAAGTYLGIKFLTAAVLESLAGLTGGDAPVALFMGEMGNSSNSSEPEQLVDYLPPPDTSSDNDLDPTVYRLLDKGRATATGFDLQNAPLSLFVYRSVGPEKLDDAIHAAETMCASTMDHYAFLRSIPREMVLAIITAATEMVSTRRGVLRDLLKRMQTTGNDS